MPPLPPLPPHRLIQDFLSPADHARLLAWTLAARDRFQPARLIGGTVDPERRIASNLREVGPLRPIFEAAVAARLADIFAAAGTRPFTPGPLELELAAHGDGAHFAPHLDLAYGPSRGLARDERAGVKGRLVSAVYYFHAEPTGFTGGALRLHRFGSKASGEPGSYVDIAPEQNALLVFPAIALHEVRRVAVPSGRFEDSRFAVNIWLAPTDSGADAAS